MTNISLDKKGYPVIKLGIAVPTESGNPFHDTFTGKFTYAPPGVNIITGKQIVQNLQPSQGRILAEASRKVNANQMTASIKDGSIVFALFRDGRLLTRFAVALQTSEGEKGKKPPTNPDPELQKGLEAPTGAFRDAIVDAARETSLEGDALRKFFEEKLNIEIDDRTLQRMAQLVDEQRINDISDYLNTYLQTGSPTNTLRLQAPRGFVRKTFANLEPDVIKEIFARLRQRGWSDEILTDKVAKHFSKARREEVLGRNIIENQGASK